MTHRLIITGSRTWEDRVLLGRMLERTLARWNTGKIIVVHGACYPKEDPETGFRPEISADWLAQIWCTENGIQSEENPADWNKYGKGAGQIRNVAMAAKGGRLCLAFPRGRTSGTMGMISACIDHFIPVQVTPGKP